MRQHFPKISNPKFKIFKGQNQTKGQLLRQNKGRFQNAIVKYQGYCVKLILTQYDNQCIRKSTPENESEKLCPQSANNGI